MNFLRSKPIKITLILLLLIASFLIILTSLNLYRYYKLRTSLAENLLEKLNERELQKLKSIILTVNNKLLTAKDMGENGLLDLSRPKALEKKLLPFLENQDLFTTIIVADEDGREFILRKEDDQKIIVRICRVFSSKTKCRYEIFDQNGKVSKWQEDINYDPRQRPWFKGAKAQNGIYWSPVYNFFESKEQGITASISWEKEQLYVVAFDIPIKRIKDILEKSSSTSLYTFLYNPDSNLYIFKDGVKILSQDKDCMKNIICLALKEWKSNKKHKKVGEFKKLGHNWYYILKPLFDKNSHFLLGVIITEKALLSDFSHGFWGLDITDILISVIGSLLILLLFWKSGLIFSEKQKNVDPILMLHEYLNQGEGNKIEFKSTVRTNLKTGKTGKEIELAWLKTVVAFLNSEGGVLLIGVDDNGKIVGIEADNFENEDKCQLHIKNLINQHIGAEFSAFISILPINVDEKTVLMIKCQRAKEPVFLKIGKNEEFYIRSGPSSIKLSPSQIVSYVMQNKKR